MASFVKEGNKVIVLLSPNEDRNSAQNLISEVEKVIGTAGETLIVDSVNLKNSKNCIVCFII